MSLKSTSGLGVSTLEAASIEVIGKVGLVLVVPGRADHDHAQEEQDDGQKPHATVGRWRSAKRSIQYACDGSWTARSQ